MMSKIDKYMLYITIISALLLALIMFLGFNNSVTETLRIIFWSIFILFLPGYWLTRIFFKKDEIDFLERFALSFALSISVVPLISFYLNLAWIKITSLSVYLITLILIVGNIFYLFVLRKKKYVENK